MESSPVGFFFFFASLFGTQRRRSHFFLSLSSPLSSLLCSLVSYWETLSALLSKLKDYGYLPIWNHDNRYFADWIRLCPGLLKNSENGNSCPKPHKAARLDLSCGKSGQHWDWDYQSQYGFYQGVAHGFTKENWLYWRPKWTKWTERVACKIGMCLLAPKTKQSYLFLAPTHSGLGKAVAGIYPRRAMQWDALASSPTLQTLQTLPLPRPLASVRFEPPACQAGLTSAGLVAAGPCGRCVVCLWCMCFCVAEVFFLFSHCTPQGA